MKAYLSCLVAKCHTRFHINLLAFIKIRVKSERFPLLDEGS